MRNLILATASVIVAVAVAVTWLAKRFETANTFLSHVLTPPNLPTIYLVLIGIGGIVVAIGTLNILGEQTKAALVSAEGHDK